MLLKIQLSTLTCMWNSYGVRILNFRLPLAIRGGLLLILVVAVLHTLDRQGEFVSRTDFLWKAKLKVEQEEVETMRGINKVKKIIQRAF